MKSNESSSTICSRARTGSFVRQEHWTTESPLSFAIQVLIPFLICGFGNLGAGLLLDMVQYWPIFMAMNELIILVPALMGLKGNLEMTLASRLSTAANCGLIDDFKEVWSITKGNLALLQCQSTVVAFLASIFAIINDFVEEKTIKKDHVFLLATSSVMTANIASISLSSFMIIFVVLCRKFKINPDNVATPIASSLGDVTTVALLAYISSFLMTWINDNVWTSSAILLFFLIITPLTAKYAFVNKYTKRIVCYGWLPIIIAMVISSFAGVVLNKALKTFSQIASFQLVINGVGGNLVAIQASRISTFLHQRLSCGDLPIDDEKVCILPCRAICTCGPHARVAQILFLMAVPSHLLYVYVMLVIKGETATFYFIAVYLLVAILQVLTLLYFSRILVFWIWKRKSDPDDCAIPLLTATGDISGVLLLTLGFNIMRNLNDPIVK